MKKKKFMETNLPYLIPVAIAIFVIVFLFYMSIQPCVKVSGQINVDFIEDDGWLYADISFDIMEVNNRPTWVSFFTESRGWGHYVTSLDILGGDKTTVNIRKIVGVPSDTLIALKITMRTPSGEEIIFDNTIVVDI